MNKASSIKIFLADGSPDGLRIVEKSLWIGRAVVCSRAQFSLIKKRPEFERPGIYLLLGIDEETQIPIAYIGEGDPVGGRIISHDRSKDFWEQLIVFGSIDGNLNKAHIQYLEARLIEIATEANRCKLDNGNVPTRPALSEADIADMENFLEEMRLVYSTVGIKIFDVPKVDPGARGITEIFQIKSASEVIAYGVDAPEGFIVKKDSRALVKEVPSFPENSKLYRASMLDRGVLLRNGEFYIFTQDFVFNSPSQAAFMILGRSANGRTEWRTARGVTLKEIQEQ